MVLSERVVRVRDTAVRSRPGWVPDTVPRFEGYSQSTIAFVFEPEADAAGVRGPLPVTAFVTDSGETDSVWFTASIERLQAMGRID